jgi:hypothetical protein
MKRADRILHCEGMDLPDFSGQRTGDSQISLDESLYCSQVLNVAESASDKPLQSSKAIFSLFQESLRDENGDWGPEYDGDSKEKKGRAAVSEDSPIKQVTAAAKNASFRCIHSSPTGAPG